MQRNDEAKEKIKKLWEADRKFSRKKAAKDLGINPRTIYKWIKVFEKGTPPSIKPTNSNLHTVSVATLIDNERLDVKKIIWAGIRQIVTGTVSYDDPFRRDLQVPESRWREYSREEEFSSVRATLPNKKVVWGKAATINEIKKMDGVT